MERAAGIIAKAMTSISIVIAAAVLVSLGFYYANGGAAIPVLSAPEEELRNHLEVVEYDESLKTDLKDQGNLEEYLAPNQFCAWQQEGTVPAAAALIVADAESDAESVKLIAEWVCENIVYDEAKVRATRDMMLADYVLSPELTLAEGSGICYDQAALITAMLRSQNIPTKLVIGTVSPAGSADHILHSWNEAWYDGMWHPIAPPAVAYSDAAVFRAVDIIVVF